MTVELRDLDEITAEGEFTIAVTKALEKTVEAMLSVSKANSRAEKMTTGILNCRERRGFADQKQLG